MNSRLDTLQAAILKVKFKSFQDFELTDINRVATQYTEKLKGKVKTPYIPEGYYSSWAQYTIQLGSNAERDTLRVRLKEARFPLWFTIQRPFTAKRPVST